MKTWKKSFERTERVTITYVLPDDTDLMLVHAAADGLINKYPRGLPPTITSAHMVRETGTWESHEFGEVR